MHELIKQLESLEVDSAKKLDAEMQSSADVEEQLWTDKYCSAKYMDLLTDEITNRKVIAWLKSWEHIVNPDFERVKLTLPKFMQPQPKNPLFIQSKQ